MWKIGLNLLNKQIHDLDLKNEHTGLSTDEVVERRERICELWQNLKSKESMLAQKSRVKWLREGDANSAFYHRCINARRSGNTKHGIKMGNSWVSSVRVVNSEAMNHFKLLFSEDCWQRPLLGNFEVKQITRAKNDIF